MQPLFPEMLLWLIHRPYCEHNQIEDAQFECEALFMEAKKGLNNYNFISSLKFSYYRILSNLNTTTFALLYFTFTI